MSQSIRLLNATDRTQPRDGVSLVELLVVMAVIVFLADMTLPSFRTMLQDQRVAQSARVVQGMAESARARAIALGRPVALVLDRVQVDTTADPDFNHVSDNICNRLSIGEVFPPYEGDWAGSTGDLIDNFDSTGAIGTDGVPDTLSIDVAKVASLIDMATNTPNGLIDEGDLLQLADHSQMFSITGITVTGTTPNVKVNVAFDNPPPGYSTTDPLWATATPDIRFRMVRRPSKTLAGSTPLPRGMCIDLSQSGVGTTGDEFAADIRAATSFADQFGPIFIVFNARGNVDGVYYRDHRSTNTPTPYKFESLSPASVMHLLVGRTEQVAPSGASAISEADDFVPNLFDVRNVWVSINPYNGAIYSAPNAAVTPSPAIAPAVAGAENREQARAFAINVLDARGS